MLADGDAALVFSNPEGRRLPSELRSICLAVSDPALRLVSVQPHRSPRDVDRWGRENYGETRDKRAEDQRRPEKTGGVKDDKRDIYLHLPQSTRGR